VKVVFDGTCLADRPLTGVGVAFLSGLRAYLPLARGPVVLLLPAGAEDPRLQGVEVLPAPRGGLRRQLQLPGLLRRIGADLLHSPVAAVPLAAPCPTIATVHDLPWLAGEPIDGRGVWRRLATRLSLRAATAVLAPSLPTMHGAPLFGAHADEVFRVPHGVLPPDAPAALEHLTGPFLVLGDDRPRKNRQRVRAAHARARQQRPQLPELRFVGPPDAYVDEADKWRILRQSRALVHCSLFEGFGLPVLEAMAHGVPVLCSDLPVLREVAELGALFVDPHDVEAIAAALLRIDTDLELRTTLRAHGLARAAKLTPHATARLWLAIHERVRR